jgi:hypothetical protein
MKMGVYVSKAPLGLITFPFMHRIILLLPFGTFPEGEPILSLQTSVEPFGVPHQRRRVSTRTKSSLKLGEKADLKTKSQRFLWFGIKGILTGTKLAVAIFYRRCLISKLTDFCT